ncbi:hypothetical protein PVAP13_1KG289966 [Panicum virgatum]|uniref:Uncharacterized protein n=1 Tax=Panicum virgatum TaxID=38727 RepID=A0A8T0XFE9_PANVG|nr:hypothetical protein PVAP13_1KG289966 [Panicum virgatum]
MAAGPGSSSPPSLPLRAGAPTRACHGGEAEEATARRGRGLAAAAGAMRGRGGCPRRGGAWRRRVGGRAWRASGGRAQGPACGEPAAQGPPATPPLPSARARVGRGGQSGAASLLPGGPPWRRRGTAPLLAAGESPAAVSASPAPPPACPASFSVHRERTAGEHVLLPRAPVQPRPPVSSPWGGTAATHVREGGGGAGAPTARMRGTGGSVREGLLLSPPCLPPLLVAVSSPTLGHTWLPSAGPCADPWRRRRRIQALPPSALLERGGGEHPRPPHLAVEAMAADPDALAAVRLLPPSPSRFASSPSPLSSLPLLLGVRGGTVGGRHLARPAHARGVRSGARSTSLAGAAGGRAAGLAPRGLLEEERHCLHSWRIRALPLSYRRLWRMPLQ